MMETDTSTTGKRPLISIVIYNYKADSFTACLDSVFAQSRINSFEVVICDDHTADGSWQQANSYMRRHPDRITLFRSQAAFGPT